MEEDSSTIMSKRICKLFIKRKNRFCKFECQEGSAFCHYHSNEITRGLEERGKRFDVGSAI